MARRLRYEGGGHKLSLWLMSILPNLSADCADCFLRYLEHEEHQISRAEFEMNLFEKLNDRRFLDDMTPLLKAGVPWNADGAARYVLQSLAPLIQGEPWQKSEDEIAVLELKSRWASCSDKKRKVNFHWKVMMAPASVIDYLIVHELCHFNHKKHNAEFWNEVDKYYPEYQKQVAWLKVYGAALDV